MIVVFSTGVVIFFLIFGHVVNKLQKIFQNFVRNNFWEQIFLNVLGINIFVDFFRTRSWTTFGKYILKIKKGGKFFTAIFKIVFRGFPENCLDKF